jgi:phage FluMu protein Com
MAAQRRKAKDRAAFADMDLVDVRCGRCDKRLASLDDKSAHGSHGYVDGIFYVPWTRGQPVHGDDWLSLKCPRCRKVDWRGRESTLAEMIVAARARGGPVRLSAN